MSVVSWPALAVMVVLTPLVLLSVLAQMARSWATTRQHAQVHTSLSPFLPSLLLSLPPSSIHSILHLLVIVASIPPPPPPHHHHHHHHVVSNNVIISVAVISIILVVAFILTIFAIILCVRLRRWQRNQKIMVNGTR